MRVIKIYSTVLDNEFIRDAYDDFSLYKKTLEDSFMYDPIFSISKRVKKKKKKAKKPKKAKKGKKLKIKKKKKKKILTSPVPMVPLSPPTVQVIPALPLAPPPSPPQVFISPCPPILPEAIRRIILNVPPRPSAEAVAGFTPEQLLKAAIRYPLYEMDSQVDKDKWLNIIRIILPTRVGWELLQSAKDSHCLFGGFKTLEPGTQGITTSGTRIIWLSNDNRIDILQRAATLIWELTNCIYNKAFMKEIGGNVAILPGFCPESQPGFIDKIFHGIVTIHEFEFPAKYNRIMFLAELGQPVTIQDRLFVELFDRYGSNLSIFKLLGYLISLEGDHREAARQLQIQLLWYLWTYYKPLRDAGIAGSNLIKQRCQGIDLLKAEEALQRFNIVTEYFHGILETIACNLGFSSLQNFADTAVVGL